MYKMRFNIRNLANNFQSHISLACFLCFYIPIANITILISDSVPNYNTIGELLVDRSDCFQLFLLSKIFFSDKRKHKYVLKVNKTAK